MAMNRRSLLALIRITTAILLCVVCADSLFALQAKLPATVTMKSNHSFVGRVWPVNGYSTQQQEAGKLCYLIEDGLRQVYVSKFQIAELPVPTNFSEIKFPIWQEAIDKIPQPGNLNNSSGFNEFGHRVISVTNHKNVTKSFVQGITTITPNYIQLSTIKSDGPKTSYRMSVGSGAVPVDVVRNLLRNQIAKSDSPIEYEAIFGYFLESQQFGEAMKELDLIERRFPQRKELVKRNRQRVRQSQAGQVVREIKLRIRNCLLYTSDAADE